MWRWRYWTRSSPRWNAEPGAVEPILVWTVLRLLTVLLLANLVAVGSAATADKLAAKLSVQDRLVVTGQPVMLEARLTQESLFARGGIGGEQLEFTVAKRSVGRAMTGGDGRAFIEFTPRMRGNFPIVVKVVESARVQAAEGAGTVFSWERRRPILLVEISALLEMPEMPTMPLPVPPPGPLAPSVPSPAPDAADELTLLTKFYYNAIYVSHGDPFGGSRDEALKAWLREHRFPEGFVIYAQSTEEGLTSRIEELRAQGWDNLKAGIGRTREFAEALLAERMAVVIVPEPEAGGAPKKAQVAKTWKDVRKKRL